MIHLVQATTENCNRVFLLKDILKNIVNLSCNFASCGNPNASCPKIAHSSPKKEEKEKESRPKPKKKNSMWEVPKCEPEDPCPEVSFDTLYYKPSDKSKRHYQQTWVSCPKRAKKGPSPCEFPTEKRVPFVKRPKRARPDTAKCMAQPMGCAKIKDIKADSKCKKIRLPGCRGVRDSVRCKLIRLPADCKGPKTPYPSFSECTHPKLKDKPPGECGCMKIRGMCAVWTLLRQKAFI